MHSFILFRHIICEDNIADVLLLYTITFYSAVYVYMYIYCINCFDCTLPLSPPKVGAHRRKTAIFALKSYFA